MVKTVPPRSEIPVEMTWELEAIYPTDDAWERDYASVSQQLPELARLQGTLGQSAQSLSHALHLRDDLGQIIERLYVYATMRSHEDTTRTHYQALADRSMSLIAGYSAAVAYFTPEILAIPQETLDAFLATEPQLAVYRHQLDDITRIRPHVRSAEVEEVLASFTEIFHAPGRIFGMIDDADLRLPVIADEEGNETQLSNGNYTLFVRSPKREVRKAAFEGMHETFKAQQNTLATILSTQVKKNIVLARTSRYDSALAMALDGNNIPVGVYTNLVETVKTKGLPALHRYLALRERALNLGESEHIYDLYAPLVPEAKVEIPFAGATERVVQALGPLGADYTAALAHGLGSRWVDVLENQNKHSGAYSFGAYGTHPFVLLNYQGQLEDVFTLAHEMGHSMHSFYSWGTQPYPYAGYTIFLAEIASTLNEALLTHYLLQSTQDQAVRAYVVNHYLDGFRATLYRQTMFADFELQMHTRAEAGESLTPDVLCGIYRDLNQQYYGDGGVVVDDLVAWEWSRIPHFYTSFYVYQYATGISASAALARAIVNEGQPAVDRYLTLLKSGSSDYSIDLLKRAGVDMTTPEPVEAAIAEFDQAITDLESLLF